MTLAQRRHRGAVDPERSRYRPPVGIPATGVGEGRWGGVLAAIALHLLVLGGVLVPLVVAPALSRPRPVAGSAEGVIERIHYTSLVGGGGRTEGAPEVLTDDAAPTVPAPMAEPSPVPVRPAVPRPQPEVATPAVGPTPPDPAGPAEATGAPPASALTPALGPGGGAAAEGAVGQGGEGVGEGSGHGLGAGEARRGVAGGDSRSPPELRDLVLPPLDVPAAMRPWRLVARFDVEASGRSRLLGFTETPDRRFNGRVRTALASVTFRPARTPDGRTVRDTAVVEIDYP